MTLAECGLPLHRGQYLEAIRLLERRLATLRQFGMIFFLPQTLYLLGKALAAADMAEQARSALEEGLQAARSIGSRWAEWQLLQALAGMSAGEQASLWLGEAQEIVTSIAGHISDPELRRSFLSQPEVQKLVAFSLA